VQITTGTLSIILFFIAFLFNPGHDNNITGNDTLHCDVKSFLVTFNASEISAHAHMG